jgi:hypothetical protein
MCHAFESEFVGNETCRELVESFYERASFVFTDPGIIPSFLVRDPWFFKVSPKKHVRKVTLRIPEALIRATTMQLLSQREKSPRLDPHICWSEPRHAQRRDHA